MMLEMAAAMLYSIAIIVVHAPHTTTRIYDACRFHKLRIAKEQATIVFIDPEGNDE